MDKEQKAVERIKMAAELSEHYYHEPLVCTYSGGKDSDILLELFKRSGVDFVVQNSHTTADAPQTVQHIRQVFRDAENNGYKCIINYPYFKNKRTSMWDLIPQITMPPTRMMRYCCDVLKEQNGDGRYIATGVRWAESTNRKKTWDEFKKIGKTKSQAEKFTSTMLKNDNDAIRRMTELCLQKNKMVVNPIIDWTDADVWDFIKSEKINVCSLYKCGYDRVGCVGCPLASRKKRLKAFADFPKYKQAYIHAFDRMITVRKSKGKECTWETGQDVFDWWMDDPNIPGQITINDYMEMEEEK